MVFLVVHTAIQCVLFQYDLKDATAVTLVAQHSA